WVAPKRAVRSRSSLPILTLPIQYNPWMTAVSSSSDQSVGRNSADNGSWPHISHHCTVWGGQNLPSGMHSGRGGCGVGSDLTTLIGAGGLLFRARWCAGLGAGPLPAMVILLVMFLVICHSASPREALRGISERLVDFSGARAPEDPQKPRETPRDATEMYPTDGRQLCDETKFRTRVRPER